MDFRCALNLSSPLHLSNLCVGPATHFLLPAVLQKCVSQSPSLQARLDQTYSPHSCQRGLSKSDLPCPCLLDKLLHREHKLFMIGLCLFSAATSPSFVPHMFQPYWTTLTLSAPLFTIVFLVTSTSCFEIQLSEATPDAQAGVCTLSLRFRNSPCLPVPGPLRQCIVTVYFLIYPN